MQIENNNEIFEEDKELFEHFKFVADKGQALLRVDKFLLDRLENTSRNKIQTAAKAGSIIANGAVIKSNYKVKPLDVIQMVLPEPPKILKLIPEDIPIEVVYEDEDLVIVNKEAGLVVHPGYGNYRGTLVNALIHHFGQLPETSELDNRPGLVHRIDKNTSGLLVIAKKEIAMTHLAKQFFDRTINRRYYALVWGDVKNDEGTIKSNLGRALKNRKVMDTFDFEGEIGKKAITHYKVVKRLGYVSLVECKLETGRTHQIRIHMKSIGHPLFNDPEYGGDRILKGQSTTNYKRFVENAFALIPGQALHARSIGFIHPTTKKEINFEINIPEGFEKIIDKFEKIPT
ncbi:MAG: 23S rRNA pseudouridine1911/1915/1917 synthase [Flavobacteriales bacterium]|jgi:23S rRNA pseudouridine1911/1915/1917 synthase|tara:strand:+ start:1989 stop:3020 length:1032 start_codon:yes stop_codon:yes gene_type:complete